MRGSAKPLLFAALALLFWSGACAAATLTVSSPSFKDGEKMPRSASCDGGDHSPALSVSGVPSESKTVAVLMFELDAPKRPAALWMAYNIPAAATVTVAENQPKTRQMKGDGLQLSCAAGKVGYCGPCPPQGATRRYLIEVFALDTALDLPENATKQQFLLAVEGHILAKGKLTGKYKK
jgi:Raf kinase inhibitor-like YbhB/YbcL family protein